METFVDAFGIIRAVGSNTGRRLAPTRPTLTAPRRPSPPLAPARGAIGAASWPGCRVCHDPARLVGGLCAPCQAESAWRAALARQGLRVVS